MGRRAPELPGLGTAAQPPDLPDRRRGIPHRALHARVSAAMAWREGWRGRAGALGWAMWTPVVKWPWGPLASPDCRASASRLKGAAFRCAPLRVGYADRPG